MSKTATFKTAYSMLAYRNGQTVEILRPVDPALIDDEVGPMFWVRFPDGAETEAFGDELTGVDQ